MQLVNNTQTAPFNCLCLILQLTTFNIGGFIFKFPVGSYGCLICRILAGRGRQEVLSVRLL